MSFTNTTPNYGLPQYLSSDKPAWMADINVAFSDIDTQMKRNADDALASQTTANNALLDIATGYSNLSTYSVGDLVIYQERLYICDVAVTVPEAFDNSKWSIYRVVDIADVADLAKDAADAIDAKVGNTDISGIGDGTCTGAIDALNTEISKNDFGTSISIPTDGTMFTAPSDGYVRIYQTYTQTGNIGVTISDGVNSIQYDNYSNGHTQSILLPIKKGMIVSTGYTQQTVSFIPLV